MSHLEIILISTGAGLLAALAIWIVWRKKRLDRETEESTRPRHFMEDNTVSNWAQEHRTAQVSSRGFREERVRVQDCDGMYGVTPIDDSDALTGALIGGTIGGPEGAVLGSLLGGVDGGIIGGEIAESQHKELSAPVGDTSQDCTVTDPDPTSAQESSCDSSSSDSGSSDTSSSDGGG